MQDLSYMSAVELARAIRKKELSPLEVMDHFLARIECRNPELNAFTYLNPEYAREQALKLERKQILNQMSGPLFGVPTALKDFLPGKPGWPGSSGGIKALSGGLDTGYSNYCMNLEQAGAVMVGKTNAPAMAYRGTTDNYLYGPTCNPFNTAYNSGGSSGGSAAAVAAGLLPIAEGTDGGGSIRIPAAWCGLFGYKASVGTIPDVARPDAFCASHPYTFDGVLTRTVEDSALVLNQMAYYDPRDPLSVERPPYDYVEELKRPLTGWRIGFTADFGIFPVEQELAEMLIRCAQLFEAAGAHVEPVNFQFRRDQYEYSRLWCEQICITTIGAVERMRKGGLDLLKDHRDDLPPELTEALEKARHGTFLDYVAYDEMRTEIYDELQQAFESYDLILSPTTACGPVRNTGDRNTLGPTSINGIKVDPSIGYCMTYFFNMTGHPAASVPMGLMANGLPAGMQIVGRRFRDADVLAASAAFEQLQPWKYIYAGAAGC